MNSTPIYYHGANYARENDELDLFRESHRTTCECRHTIEKAISENFDGFRLSRAALDSVLEQFAPDRVALVLAAAVQDRYYDGRWANRTRSWAAGIRIPTGDADRLYMIGASTHPAILDGFIGQFINATA